MAWWNRYDDWRYGRGAPQGGYYRPSRYGAYRYEPGYPMGYGGEYTGFRGGRGYAGRYGAEFGAGYGGEFVRRVPPRQSPAYGRGGDRLLRRELMNRGYGYGTGYVIQPRRSSGRMRSRRGYTGEYGW